jgi:hypothetical protein
MHKHENTPSRIGRNDAQPDLQSASKPLTRADLLSLLYEDTEIRVLIHDIATTPSVSATQTVHEADEAADKATAAGQSPVRPRPQGTDAVAESVDTLRTQLGRELTLLQKVQADADLAPELLGEQTDEGQQLLQLVVSVAQWDVLSDLWDKLANRCKQMQRMASAEELYILRIALALHNLRWRGREARFVEAAAGTIYDYERHQRGTTTGELVHAQWLPGLVNAGGQLQKKPLVQT